jgi:hypothetical protein
LKTNTSFVPQKEKTPRTLPSGGDVCRAIFAPFFLFLFFLVNKKGDRQQKVLGGQPRTARIASQK